VLGQDSDSKQGLLTWSPLVVFSPAELDRLWRMHPTPWLLPENHGRLRYGSAIQEVAAGHRAPDRCLCCRRRSHRFPWASCSCCLTERDWCVSIESLCIGFLSEWARQASLWLCLLSLLELTRPRESEVDAPLWRHSYTLPRVRAALYSHSRLWPHQIYSATIIPISIT